MKQDGRDGNRQPTCIYGERLQSTLLAVAGESFGEEDGWTVARGPVADEVVRVCALFVSDGPLGVTRVGVFRELETGVGAESYGVVASHGPAPPVVAREEAPVGGDVVRRALRTIDGMGIWQEEPTSDNDGSTWDGLGYLHLVSSRAVWGVMSGASLGWERNSVFLDLFALYDEALFGGDFADVIGRLRSEVEEGVNSVAKRVAMGERSRLREGRWWRRLASWLGSRLFPEEHWK
jgi:hypothetical protein